MSDRKKDHIELALQSQRQSIDYDPRFTYEPLLGHHQQKISLARSFLGKQVQYPIWISSMTGGTEKAKMINYRLAKLANHFGLGMGLGSLRPLLESPLFFADFDIRSTLGDSLPLYGNLGVAQVEQLLRSKQTDRLSKIVEKLRLDGLFIHINPLQEFLQPEGDRFNRSPLETICEALKVFHFPLMIKEVGSGMGPKSMAELWNLPIAGLEFGAWGGTNFALLELLRQSPQKKQIYGNFANIGHDAMEMVKTANHFQKPLPVIISGGVKDFLDGYYLLQQSKHPAVYGMASRLLSMIDDEVKLYEYMQSEIEGLIFAHQFLRIRE